MDVYCEQNKILKFDKDIIIFCDTKEIFENTSFCKNFTNYITLDAQTYHKYTLYEVRKVNNKWIDKKLFTSNGDWNYTICYVDELIKAFNCKNINDLFKKKIIPISKVIPFNGTLETRDENESPITKCCNYLNNDVFYITWKPWEVEECSIEEYLNW